MTKNFIVNDPYLQGEQVTVVIEENSLPPEIVETGKRDSIQEAFEDALWELGGVHYLKRLAKQNPLEFAKLLSKFGQPINQGSERPPATIVMTLQDNSMVNIEPERLPAPNIIDQDDSK